MLDPEYLHVGAPDTQPPALDKQKEPTTPKRMLKSLKRVYNASVTCFETHIRLSSHQSALQRKLALKSISKDDIQDVRKISEDLIFILQLPHDRSTYNLALRLLSSIATASDPLAFVLLERHISPILRYTLETSLELPPQKATALLLVLDHLDIRHRISNVRRILTDASAAEYPDMNTVTAVERSCRELISLFDSEMWVKMMVQDLLALVAKTPSISWLLLQQDIYPAVVKIAGNSGLNSAKLSRRLVRLVAESSTTILRLKQRVYPLLGKKALDDEELVAQDAYRSLIHLARSEDRQERLAAIGILEHVAQSRSAATAILIRPEYYEAVERMWALGSTSLPVDKLYRLLNEAIVDSLANARAFIATCGLNAPPEGELIPSASSDVARFLLPTELSDQLVGSFRNLLSICTALNVYDEKTIEEALDILSGATDQSDTVSFGLVDPSLLPFYALLAEGQPSASVRRLQSKIERIQARKQAIETITLVQRLKRTRNWSGLDGDNARPLCQILISCALDDRLHDVRGQAIDALIELSKSPPSCSSVLLEPDLTNDLRKLLSKSRDQPSSTLSESIITLELQRSMQNGISRLVELSNKRSDGEWDEAEEYESTVRGLARAYDQHKKDETLLRTLYKSILVVATGNDRGRRLLEAYIGNTSELLSKAENEHTQGAVRDVIRHLETLADRLLQQSPPPSALMFAQPSPRQRLDHLRTLSSSSSSSPGRDLVLERLAQKQRVDAEALCWRLLAICRLGLSEWSVDAALELLGSLIKGSEAVYLCFEQDGLRRALRGLATNGAASGRWREHMGQAVRRLVVLIEGVEVGGST